MKNEDILWVSPDGSDEELGSFDQPFSDISLALKRIQPGHIITLKPGIYSSDLTIQQSGTRDRPIRICAEKEGTAEITNACWYLYDVSDFIISGLLFRNAPAGALSVIGACESNRFEKLRFINCGLKNPISCSFFFGGSGSRCNVIEECTFSRDIMPKKSHSSPDSVSVGLMITEGDDDGSAANKDFIIRKCNFTNYDYAIIAGSRDAAVGQYGHCIEYNHISNCITAGITARCGDTTIRGNRIENIHHAGIAVVAGVSSLITDNRISGCETGIGVAGTGHTIANNCIFRCKRAVHVAGKSGPETVPATAIVIEQNTIVDHGSNGQTQSKIPPEGIAVDMEANCVVEENLFYGQVRPYNPVAQKPVSEKILPLFARNNVMWKHTGMLEGCSSSEVIFSSYETDTFTNSSGYGASGWVLTPEPYEPDLAATLKDMAGELDDDDPADLEASYEDEEQDDEENPSFDIKSFFTGEGLDPEISVDQTQDEASLN
jgi:hypothetical protein